MASMDSNYYGDRVIQETISAPPSSAFSTPVFTRDLWEGNTGSHKHAACCLFRP